MRRINTFEYQYRHILNHLRNYLHPQLSYVLMEVGAGDRVLKGYLPENVTYISLDLEGEHDYLLNLDTDDLPLKDQSVDIIVCTETLEHTAYPYRVMNELMRVGKNNAVYFLSMPNEYNFWLRLQYLFGIKKEMHMPFVSVEEHLHIHLPRVSDILLFFRDYLRIFRIHYIWQTRGSLSGGIKGIFCSASDPILRMLASFMPSLFCRVVLVVGKKRL